MTASNFEVILDDLRKRLEKQRKLIGEHGNRIAIAEKAVRDLSKDRDQWKVRALIAEAELKSLRSVRT